MIPKDKIHNTDHDTGEKSVSWCRGPDPRRKPDHAL